MNDDFDYYLSKINRALGIPYEYLGFSDFEEDDGLVDIKVDEYREELTWLE